MKKTVLSTLVLALLAAALHAARPHLQGLDETERAAIDTYIRHAGNRTSTFETRRILDLAGRGLSGADPAVVADFALAGADHVYDDFFKTYDETPLIYIDSSELNFAESERAVELLLEVIKKRPKRRVYLPQPQLSLFD